MKKSKTFDAVELKNTIQAGHRQSRAGMSDEQVRESVARRLDTSEHPLARKWRRLTQTQRRSLSSNNP